MDNENATISSGRYDYLVEEIGGPPTPGVGFGAGIERLLIAMQDEGVADAEAPAVEVFMSSPTRTAAVPPLLQGLRQLGGRRRLRRPLAQGPAHPGRPFRSEDDGDPPRFYEDALIRRQGAQDEPVAHTDVVGRITR